MEAIVIDENMESQLDLNKEREELLDKFLQANPELGDAVSSLVGAAYKEGALSSKIKRLLALGIATKVGCTNCVLAQTMNALENGATVDEIMETLSVVVSMGGTTGVAESLRVTKLLDELEKL